MACPVCPSAGWVGGCLGGYMGVSTPKNTRGRILSAVLTAQLVCITVVALKQLFNFSLCVGGVFNLKNVVRVLIPTFGLGVAYSIVVNYLLNLYTASSIEESCLEKEVFGSDKAREDQPPIE